MFRELITKFEQINNQKWSTYTRTRHCNNNPELHPPDECGCVPQTGTILYIDFGYIPCTESFAAFRTPLEGLNPCDGNVGVLIDRDLHLENCEELQINSDDTIFKERMQTLKNNNTGSVEKGFGIYNGSYNDPPASNPACSTILSGTSQNGPEIPFHPTIKALAHNHLKDSIYNHIGTFAPKDILQFTDMITLLQQQNSQVTNSELATYLVSDEGNYALKVSDNEKLYNFAVKYGTDVDFRDRINRFYKRNNMVHGKDKQDQNIGFLTLMKNFDIGVNLYEADENFENWEQLKLNNAGDDINKTPC